METKLAAPTFACTVLSVRAAPGVTTTAWLLPLVIDQTLPSASTAMPLLFTPSVPSTIVQLVGLSASIRRIPAVLQPAPHTLPTASAAMPLMTCPSGTTSTAIQREPGAAIGS